MAMKIQDIERILDEMTFKYARKDENTIGFGMRMENYQRPDDDAKSLVLVVQLLEDGEYFNLFAPRAFQVKGANQDAFLRACAIVQWRTKLIQFEWDESDGEVRPTVEFPIEDGVLTTKQFARCVNGMCSILDQFYPVLRKAADEGVVEFPSTGTPPDVGLMRELMERLMREGGSDEDRARALEDIAQRLRGRPGDGESGTPQEL
jgi:hypothetical protein